MDKILAKISFEVTYYLTDECESDYNVKYDAISNTESIIDESICSFLNENYSIENVSTGAISEIMFAPSLTPYVMCSAKYYFDIEMSNASGVLKTIIDDLYNNSNSIILEKINQLESIKDTERSGLILGRLKLFGRGS